MKEYIKDLERLRNNISHLLFKLNPDKPYDALKGDDKSLIFDHSMLHNIWNKLSAGEKVEGWVKSKVSFIHNIAVKEMFKRGFKHTYNSKLDDTLNSSLKKQTVGMK